MDPFQKLPAPITEYILKLLPDLPTLYTLHNASPTIFSLQHEDGVSQPIIESILTQTYPSQIQFLLRTLTLLHWHLTLPSTHLNNSVLPATLPALLNPLNQTSRSGHPIASSYGDVPLPTSLPPALSCALLALATHVHALSHACMHGLLERCNALRPQHLANPGFAYKRRWTFEAYLKLRDGAKGVPYRIGDGGMPRWAEEMRVQRAVWRVVVFFEIKAAVERGVISLGEEGDGAAWGMEGPGEFWGRLLVGGEAEEMRTVVEWMVDSGVVGSGDAGMRWSGDLRGKWEGCCMREVGPVTEAEWEDARREFDQYYAPGYAFGKQAITNLASSPLRFVDFAVFRPYGFAIWDKRRMMALGFLEDFHRSGGAERPLLSESNLFFTWQSILTEEQREELERYQREHWRG